jgi:hypothetical protein
MEEPATTQTKEGNTSSLRVINTGASTTLGTFSDTDQRIMMVVHLSRLVSYHGTARDELP